MFYAANKLRHSTYFCTPSGKHKVNGIIRTCPKASLSAAFRRFGIERRQPSCNLNIQKSAENSSLSGRRIFTEQIFGQSRHKAEQILCGFASILTTSERKYARENHGSNYSIHLNKAEALLLLSLSVLHFFSYPLKQAVKACVFFTALFYCFI